MQVAAVALSIELDERVTGFGAGQTIRGVVHRKAHDDCHCERMSIGVVRKAAFSHRRGYRHEVHGDMQRVEQRWNAGQSRTMPFEIEAPEFPPTYLGKLMTLTWELEATAAFAGHEDLKAVLPVTIQISDEAGADVHSAEPADPEAVGRISKTPLLVTTIVLALGVLGTVWGQLADSWLFYVGIVLTLLGAFFTFAAIINYRDRKKVGNLQIAFQPGAPADYRAAAPSASQQCMVWMREGAPVDRMVLKLEAVEVENTNDPGQDNGKRYTEQAFAQDVALAKVAPGMFRGTFVVHRGEGAPFSLGDDSYQTGVHWSATARAFIREAAGGGTVDKKVEVKVRPGTG